MNHWVVIGREGCVWCERAEALLRENGFIPLYLSITDNEGLREFLRGSDLRTVPQVYRNGHRVGGFEELKQFLAG